MRIGEIDFPADLLAAQLAGKLVVFAGAGVSIGAPANYPDFRGLVRKIGRGTGISRESAEEPNERYLGRLETRGVKVHELAQQLLTDPTSKPNPLHNSLIRLFAATGVPKIVTTNFETHFTTETNRLLSTAVETHSAPALPVGNRINGLVYLHGAVNGPPDRLVLTDRDFGRAYLTEGWARRFLQELYAAYTVLFIGYSHNDTVMNYLTRGLPPGSAHLYAFTPNESADRWRYLGVTPILYPTRKRGDRHAALRVSVAAWADRVSMQAFDHEERVRAIVAGAPPLPGTEDDDYMQSVAQETEKHAFFVRHAAGKAWILWAQDRGLLSALFSRRTERDQRLRALAWWFFREAVLKEPELGLGIFERHGQSMSRDLWFELARGFHSEKEPNPSSVRKWLPVLLEQSTPEDSSELLQYLFSKAATAGSWSLALLLFEHQTRPRIRFEKGSYPPDGDPDAARSARPQVDIAGSHHWLKEAWDKTFKPNVELIAHDVARVTAHNIRLAYDLGVCHDIADPNWEPLSYHRSAIEPHEQNNHLEHDFDTVIDACRDSLEWLLSHDRRAARSLIGAWLANPAPILRRIAVHGLRLDSGTAPDGKLRLIINHQLLASVAVHHELFLLLQEAYPRSAPPMRRTLLEHARSLTETAVKAHPDDDPAMYWRALFTVFAWLDKAADGKCPLAGTRMRRLLKRNPSFCTSEHPDFTHWSGGVRSYVPESPVSADGLLAKPLNDVIHLMDSYKETDWTRPNRDGLLSALTAAAKKDPDWGFRASSVLLTRTTTIPDVLPHFFAGWRDAEFTDDHWRRLLNLLARSPALLACYRDAAGLLEQGVRREKNRIPESLMPLAERIGARVWCVAEKNEKETEKEAKDWLQCAINEPGGKLAEFFMTALSIRRKNAGSKWKGIPVSLKSHLDRIALSRGHTGEMGRILLASQLHFLFSSDPHWTKRRVLPLLAWRRNKRPAIQAWHGFVFWGRCTEQLLPALMPLYRRSFPRLSTDLQHVREYFVAHIASICMFSSRRETRGRWLSEFLRSVSSPERKEFAESIRKLLWDLDPKKAARLWADWLDAYWADRLMGKPVPLEKEEASKMAEWAPHMGTAFPGIVQRIVATQAVLDVDDFIYHLIKEKNIPSLHPLPTAELLLTLVKTSYTTDADYGDLPRVIEELAKDPATHDLLRQVLDAMANKGSQKASELRGLLAAPRA